MLYVVPRSLKDPDTIWSWEWRTITHAKGNSTDEYWLIKKLFMNMKVLNPNARYVWLITHVFFKTREALGVTKLTSSYATFFQKVRWILRKSLRWYVHRQRKARMGDDFYDSDDDIMSESDLSDMSESELEAREQRKARERAQALERRARIARGEPSPPESSDDDYY